jgi:hypothetical protein
MLATTTKREGGMKQPRELIDTYWASEYDDLREIIHRRPSAKASAPCLIRHRSWWLEPRLKKSATGESASSQSDEKLKIESTGESTPSCSGGKLKTEDHKDIENFFNELKTRFGEIFSEKAVRVESPTTKVSIDVPFPKRQYIMFSGYWLNMYCRYIISLHDERVSLTQINDISYQRQIKRSGSPDQKEGHKAQRKADVDKGSTAILFACEKALQKVCESASQHKKLLLRHHSSTEAEQSASTNEIPNWREQMERELAAMADADFQSEAETLFYRVWDDVDNKIPLKTVERGTVVDSGKRLSIFADFRAILFPADFATERELPPRHRTISMPSAYKAVEAAALVGAVWPFFRGSEKGDLGKELTSKDVIACLVQEKSAIYISTMGNSSTKKENMGQERSTPVKYLLISFSTSRWFNGRLIDMFNRLGVYRLIALRDNGGLRTAGAKIKNLGSDLDRISVDVLTNIKRGAMDEVRWELGRFFREFQDVGTSVDGGLQYRTYRSTTYSDAFRALLEQLDVHGIGGFQRYDHFVKKQVFGVFKYIDSLGGRVREVRERYLALVNYVEMHDIGEMERERNATLQSAEMIEKFAGAYYVSYIFLGIFLFLAPFVYSRLSSAEKPDKELILSLIMIAVLGFLVFRASSRSQKLTALLRRTFLSRSTEKKAKVDRERSHKGARDEA